MAVGDLSMPIMHPVNGVRIGIAEAYIRYKNRRDLVVFELAPKQQRRLFLPPMLFVPHLYMLRVPIWHKQHARYLVINTGNANAGTGTTGMTNASVVVLRLLSWHK
jgi:glutamate N-acetyltransferase/amino-acid N-acetyltransferase